MKLKILVTGEGPWTRVDGGRPGWFIGSHISEVRTLCVAEALSRRGHEVHFLSSRGEEDDVGGFSFRCVGPHDYSPRYYDVLVCHQAMFWYHKGFEHFRHHPRILMTGDLVPMGDGVLTPNMRWVFFDAPNHPAMSRYRERLPQTVVTDGCFGVTEYDALPCPFEKRVGVSDVVYLGKIYPGAYCLPILNEMAGWPELRLHWGGRIDGTFVGQRPDSDVSPEQRNRLFDSRINFVADRGVTTIMEAAAYAQHADIGLVFDPHVRHATVSKIYFYISNGLPVLVIGGCANEEHVVDARAGHVLAERDIIRLGDVLRREISLRRDRRVIRSRALKMWGYDVLVRRWEQVWEAAW